VKLARVGILLLVFTCIARSSSLPIVMRDENDVARVILGSQRTLFVIAPQLHSRSTADALRTAAVERGVRVLILCDARRVLERGGYVASLSLLTQRFPIQIRVLQGISSLLLIADESRSVTGPLIADAWTFGQSPTRLDLERSVALERAGRFWSSWKRAKPWSYRVQNPSFLSPGGTK
jgi:hypothetical protein